MNTQTECPNYIVHEATPIILKALEAGLACAIAWGGKCEANNEMILAKEAVLQAERIRAAILLLTN